jgi:hypothetical protein
MSPDAASAPLAISVETARAVARQLEVDNPLWIVVFGVYSKEFVGFPRFTAPGGAIVIAQHPIALPPRMRQVENSARDAVAALRAAS